MIRLKTAILSGLVMVLICPAVPAQTGNLDELLTQAAKHEFHQGREAVFALADIMVHGDISPAARRDHEQKLIAFLSSDTTYAGKDFICRYILSLIGSEASAPVLGSMLRDPQTAEIARYALERIPGEEVNRVLRESLTGTSEKTRIGIINTIGSRRDAGSVEALRPLALSTDQGTSEAVWFALADIASPAALRALDQVYEGNRGPLYARVPEAYLKGAENANPTAALPIFRKLYAADVRPVVRAGALNGIARTGGSQALPMLTEALHGSDERLQTVAIRAMAASAPNGLTAEMPKISEAGQVRVLGVLAERGERSALPAFIAALQSPSKPVRLAAIEGLTQVGNASVVTTLARIGAGEDTDEQTAARASLAQLPGRDVDQAVVDGIVSAELRIKLELIRAANGRGTAAAAPVLLKMARDSSDDVRRESLRALRGTASADNMPELVALVVNPARADDRTEAVRTLSAVVGRSGAAGFQSLLSSYQSAPGMEARSALLQVMGQSGNPETLPVLRRELNGREAGLQRAAILALTEWPDTAPLPDLFGVARGSSNPAHQVLALRGVLRLIGLPDRSREPADSVKMLADVMSLATQADEKRAVLGLLPRFRCPEALALAQASMNDPAVVAEAKAAADQLQRPAGRRRRR